MNLSKRHHFIAQCYQRNFAEPMFGDEIRVFDYAQNRWNDTRRTPNGVGWSKLLNVHVNEEGNRTDEVEALLARLDNDVVPAFRKAAAYRHREMNDQECTVLALFMATLFARLPETIETVTTNHYASRPPDERRLIDDEVERLLAKPNSPNRDRVLSEVLKRDYFAMAWDMWIPSFVDRLLSWHWFWIQTDHSNPFVTSDEPLYRERDLGPGVFLVSFPVSSEVAILICNRGELVKTDGDRMEQVEMINRQTMAFANEFVICHTTEFPGDKYLATRASLE